MSATGKTINYNLPTYVGTDKTSWLTDFNGAMTKIDTQIKVVETSVSTATQNAGNAMASVEVLQPLVSTNTTTIASALSKANEALSGVADIWRIIYPLGSIFLSTVNTSPAILMGGTWETFGVGKTIIGVDTTQTEFSTSGQTGGSKKVTLSIPEIPTHQHRSAQPSYAQLQNAGSSAGVPNATKEIADTTGQVSGLWGGFAGENRAHENLPPYITCYMWKRIV